MQRRRLEAAVRKFERMQRRKPKQAFFEEGWDDLRKPPRQCAERFGVDSTSAVRWYSEVRFLRAKEKLRAFLADEFPVSEQELPESHFDWTPAHYDLLVSGFLEFRERFFKTPQRTPYQTYEVQQGWVRTILRALLTGDREGILAPQRHGKTMLLTHLCTYLICLDPNIRILWISRAIRTAKKSVNLIRSILASNEELIEAYAGVGNSFVPDKKSTYSWTGEEFTVATRKDYDINGPNMQALGREGTILSLNADIIIVDDIEDRGSVTQLGTRDNTKEWWDTQLMSRKQEHTGVFVIGSRQHADDLYSHLLANDQWNVTVERAHDPACNLVALDFPAHVDCMLIPEICSYRWVWGQRLAMGDTARWEMIYQNVARTKGLVVFPEEDLHACRSLHYRARTVPQSKAGENAVRLIGGLDPAISGYQAAVLLAYQTVPDLRIWLVDLENKLGGGVSAAARVIRNWYEKYGLTDWIAEDNLLGELHTYQEIKDVTVPHGIQVRPKHTGHNKNDQFYGVTSLASLFAEKQFVFPYADDNLSQPLSDELIRQLAIWDEGNSRNKNRTGDKDDLVMALWMAWDPIRRARQEWNAEMGVDYDGGYRFSDWDQTPWGDWEQAPWAS